MFLGMKGARYKVLNGNISRGIPSVKVLIYVKYQFQSLSFFGTGSYPLLPQG